MYILQKLLPHTYTNRQTQTDTHTDRHTDTHICTDTPYLLPTVLYVQW